MTWRVATTTARPGTAAGTSRRVMSKCRVVAGVGQPQQQFLPAQRRPGAGDGARRSPVAAMYSADRRAVGEDPLQVVQHAHAAVVLLQLRAQRPDVVDEDDHARRGGRGGLAPEPPALRVFSSARSILIKPDLAGPVAGADVGAGVRQALQRREGAGAEVQDVQVQAVGGLGGGGGQRERRQRAWRCRS